ncbi:Rieske 2Fe-2S domain-containing protein [Streptomyces mirabilis]
MALDPKPAEDCVSPEFYEVEREAVFKRAWLNVGRVEDLTRKGSYFTKEIEVADTSIIVVRDLRGRVRAFHNICGHRGNKLLGTMITPLDGPHRMVTPGGTNPGKVRKWAMDNFQIFPNMEIPIWASGWYLTYRYWPTSCSRSSRSRTPAPSWGPSGRWSHGRPGTTSLSTTRSCWYGTSTGRRLGRGIRAQDRGGVNRCRTPSCPRRSRSWNPSPRPGARPPSPSATSAAWRAT